jgi:predicted phage-related endonuclease
MKGKICCSCQNWHKIVVSLPPDCEKREREREKKVNNNTTTTHLYVLRDLNVIWKTLAKYRINPKKL